MRHVDYLCRTNPAKMTLIHLRFDHLRFSICHFCSTVICVLLVALLSACSQDGLTREQRAVRKAAERDYDLLIDGKYDAFIGEIAYADQMSKEYRAQMADLVHEHAASLSRQHGGLVSAQAVDDTIANGQAHVFLQLVFKDETTEEVGLLMVKVEDDWKMQ